MERVNVELRSSNLEGNRLSGIAHAYGQMTKRGGKYETFAQGAFNRVLANPNTDVRAFYNHNPSMILGRQKAGTLQVTAEDDGLHFAVDIPDTSYGNDLKTLINRGDIDGASFGFMPGGKFEMSRAKDGLQVRTWLDIAELIDVSPVALPAFEGTSLQLRSFELDETSISQLIKARARALRS